jgi:hypothetical protein
MTGDTIERWFYVHPKQTVLNRANNEEESTERSFQALRAVVVTLGAHAKFI